MLGFKTKTYYTSQQGPAEAGPSKAKTGSNYNNAFLNLKQNLPIVFCNKILQMVLKKFLQLHFL